MSFGNGPSLDDDFDFTISSTGDLTVAREAEELNKDLSMQLTVVLQEFLGETPGTNVETRALSKAIEVVELDTRIDSVQQETSSVTLSSNGRELTTDLDIITRNGNVENFSFTVSE